MPKFVTILLIVLFVATPLVAFLSFHEDCSEQACHMLMTNLFIMISTTVVTVFFLASQLTNKALLFHALYRQEIFLPPRLLSIGGLSFSLA